MLQPIRALFALAFFALFFAADSAFAGTETILYSFSATVNGQFPAGGLISDSAGNLYGTTLYGGADGNGAVFMLSPSADGGWTETVLYSFKGYVNGATDGMFPIGSLTFDGEGNLYGATTGGGPGSRDGFHNSAGTIFKLTKKNGKWTESILWSFENDSVTDGFSPLGGLVFDKSGNLYGTTYEGGGEGGGEGGSCGVIIGCGTVFRLVPTASGPWKEEILYVFLNLSDGAFPDAGLAIDQDGNLYGTNLAIASSGLVFEVSNSGGAWKETTLYTFTGGADGGHPGGSLILDQTGNLYGVTLEGGTSAGCSGYPCGTVFELSPGSSGWTEEVLHSFSGTDGSSPEGGLSFDSSGNLYGTTAYGGSDSYGVVFELSPVSSGWSESTLWNFTGLTDGAGPSFGVTIGAAGQLYGAVAENTFVGNGVIFELTSSQGVWSETTLESFPFTDGGAVLSGVIADSSGNLYGTTSEAGSRGFGTAFKLTNSGEGWQEQTLYNFTTGVADGTYSYSDPSALLFDNAGNLYGETEFGGSAGYGMVFELSPASGGSWTEKTLFNFTGSTTGEYPVGGLIFDSDGNLYGTTSGGGLNSCYQGCGTVFKLTPSAQGAWDETVVHFFAAGLNDGGTPKGGVIFDKAGNLYGTTDSGGISGFPCPATGCGVVFSLSPSSGSKWTESVLHEFSGAPADGANPVAGLVFDQAGNLYGTTIQGGSQDNGTVPYGYGAVFELSPKSGGWSETMLYGFPGTGGVEPVAPLIVDSLGNLYGTAENGQIVFGTVFELSPSAGSWTETLLHGFPIPGSSSPRSGDGFYPESGLLFGPSGVLYGTTVDGGQANWGTVYKITP